MDVALLGKGSQDVYIIEHNTIKMNAFEYINDVNQYQVSYQKISVEKQFKNNTIMMTFDNTNSPYLISALDMCIYEEDYKHLNSITLEIGGQRFDKIYSKVQLETNAVLYKRPITRFKDKRFMPLTLALFHENNFAPMCAMRWHELIIIFEFDEDYTPKNTIDLYGTVYLLSNEARKKIAFSKLSFMTQQSQYHEIDIDPNYSQKKECEDGVNEYTIKMNYLNHPVGILYFWGFDLSAVENIQFTLNKKPYYNDSIIPLLHYQQKRLEGASVDPLVFFINEETHKIGQSPKSTINFSRIDHFEMILKTTENLDSKKIKVVGINYQPVEFANGMVGLRFSK
jgi:hypothetical protein